MGESSTPTVNGEATIERLTTQVDLLKQALAREQADANLLRRSLEAVFLISEATSDFLFTNQFFERIADILLDITGFETLTVFLYEPECEQYRLAAVRGLPSEVWDAIKTVPANLGDFASIVAETKQPVYTSDHPSDPRAAIKGLDDLGMPSLMLIPLLAGDRYIGFFGLNSHQVITWSDAQLRFLASLGRQIGLVINHAHLAARMRGMAVVEERLRLGGELHDSLAQTLGFLNLQMTIANNLLSRGQISEAQVQLQEMKGQTKAILDDVSEVIVSLRTSYVQGQFLPMLQEFLADYRIHSGIAVGLTVSDRASLRFSPQVSVQLVRIVQEALTNVRKHAGASQVRIHIEPDGDWTQISVIDNGKGFDPAQVGTLGTRQFGLRIMRERAESVGATLEVDAQPGRGSRVVIRARVTGQA
jgi:signal transduction histidine kinase